MFPDPRTIHVGDRVLTVEDTGPEDGIPVLHHSGGGSRHVAPTAVAQAHAAGLRVIGYDRPDYGGSTPLPGRTLADCAEDVRAIVRELGLTRLAVWGFSGGGPYALATAALLPDVVEAVCLFAPLGPYGEPGLDFLAGMADSYREEVEVFFADRRAAREKFRVDHEEIHTRLSTSEGWLRMWGDRALTDEAHGQAAAEYLASLFRDGWTHGEDGWWDDWSAFLHPWGFDVAAVRAPVVLWHGLRDTRCPPAHSRWIVSRLPNVTAHFPPEHDHTDIEDDHRETAYAWIRATMGQDRSQPSITAVDGVRRRGSPARTRGPGAAR